MIKINKDIIKNIQNKEMDRKDFLKYGAMAVVSLVGLKGVVTLLTSHDGNSKSLPVENHKSQTSGYGGGSYGA